MGSKEWFDLDLWTCYLKIYKDHLLIEGNPCTKFGIDQVKESKDIERTTQWAKKSDLTLTFEHVTWKSIGIIYSLGAPLHQVWYWSSERVKRYWADNTMGWEEWAEKSGLTLTFEDVTWKSIGIIYLLGATPAPSLVLIKWRGQKILSWQHSQLRRGVWPWPLNMWPENQ